MACGPWRRGSVLVRLRLEVGGPVRKPDEIALYSALRGRARVRAGGERGESMPAWLANAAFLANLDSGLASDIAQPGLFAISEEAERIGIHPKRALRIVEKWVGLGWWEFGVSLRGGWFTKSAPEELSA